MTPLTPSDLPELTGGFLAAPDLTPCLGGILVRGRFDRAHFDPALFDRLALPRPERLSRAVDKRLAEFLAGRALARLAQETLGHVAQPVGIAESRAPVWPAGLSGSISHARGHCACLLLPAAAGQPGIDVEAIASGRALVSIEQIALSARDTAQLHASRLPFDVAATLCFSAKETLYKALFPTVRRFFGFEAAEVASPPDARQIRLRLTEDLHGSLPRGAVFDLTCEITGDSVLTWMCHPG
ncbi:4'-phosphopantetheinyl transferase family protein [Tropicibacter sp. S64]|uniref:4'-phosphopantetheinyl transferase family protein n=1 Tax=Tropicibacter sp. S64 TaxID=3415122 RepID=UPI003C7B1C36